ncbi:MAG TPA: hypothetical protein VFJ06_06620 [Halococcus sp.]|nr:hypothetical protein [Halococcus sp.]
MDSVDSYARQEEIDQPIARLREKWADDRLRELSALAPCLEEKMALTRREGIRQGYVADGRGSK